MSVEPGQAQTADQRPLGGRTDQLPRRRHRRLPEPVHGTRPPHTAFTNLPPNIETTVEWIADTIAETERRGATTVEVTHEAEDQWVAACEAIANQTLFPKADSWLFGANIPGKTPSVRLFMGGLATFRQALAQEANTGYPNFEFDASQPTLAHTAPPSNTTPNYA